MGLSWSELVWTGLDWSGEVLFTFMLCLKIVERCDTFTELITVGF